ncbi:MAG: AEC family transporter [Chthoniobacterales bacterium]
MHIFETLAPIIILLAVGAALARWRFLGREFMSDLNRLVFYLALPSLIFMSVATAAKPADDTLTIIAVLSGATMVSAAVGGALARWVLRIPFAALGTFVQSAFRGNLMFVGVPILTYALAELPTAEREKAMATIFLAITPIMVLYNVLSVIALQASDTQSGRGGTSLMLRNIATNPLILACAVGLLFMHFGLPVPIFVGRSLDALGGAAVPVALLCVGGTLHSIELSGNRVTIIAAAVVKVFIGPVVAFAMARACGLNGTELQIIVVLVACPTATAAYIMARQMRGDDSLAAGSIALSTILAFVSLALALALTS